MIWIRAALPLLLLCSITSGCAGQGVTIEPVEVATTGDDAASRALFSSLLADHVDAGRVDYAALCEDARLERYLGHLSATDPATLGDGAEALAFWLNVYNAFTLKIICDNYPVESINDLHFGGLVVGIALKSTIWDKDFIHIHGKQYSLNHVEHEIVRPVFDDARVHFALVCAAVSCPPLRPEAYEAERLDAQLDDQGRIFLANAAKNRFDAETRTAYLSKIFAWFDGDFGENDEERLAWIGRFAPESVASSLQEDPGSWKVEHLDYDWSLNE